MKTIGILLFASFVWGTTLVAQDSQYPRAIATLQQLGQVANGVTGALNNSLTTSSTSMNITNGTCTLAGQTTACSVAFQPNMFVTVQNEIMEVCSMSAGSGVEVLNFGIAGSSCPDISGRGLDGTQIAAHTVPSFPNKITVNNNITAWTHNANSAEIIGLETTQAEFIGADNTGTADATTAINTQLAAYNSAARVITLPPGTYKLTSGSVVMPSNTCLVGSGSGTILQETGAFPAILIQDVHNVCVRNLQIQSANDGILIRSTNVSLPTEYIETSNIFISQYSTSGGVGIHLDNTNNSPIYWVKSDNNNITNNGSVGTQSCYKLEGTQSTYNILPIIIGGRCADAKYGINASSAEHLIVRYTEFDDIIASGSGISIWIQTGVQDSDIDTRFEGAGVGGNDKDFQSDAGSFYSKLTLNAGYAGSSSNISLGGGSDCLIGSGGSGGLVNNCTLPQSVGNFTIDSTYSFSMPGLINNQLNVNGGLTTNQTATSLCLICIKLPNSNTGSGIAVMSDSVGHAINLVSQGFNLSGNSGTSNQINDQGMSCTKLGVSNATPCNINILTLSGTQLANFDTSAINGTILYCNNCKNVVDDAAVAGAVCIIGGNGAMARRENNSWRCN